ncbi:MAG: SMI1/KNR4 family protein [Chthoniobacter sp.]|nr:SMI1/KNR4 family protein [Chthoniobacter sp.]
MSPAAINALGSRLGGTVPDELAAYLAELGDGFSIQWGLGDWHAGGHLFDAGLSFTDDIASEHASMQEDLRQIVSGADAPNALREEARRRLAWVPIMGVGEGGNIFCLDPTASSNRIRYHDIRWTSYPPELWRVSLGDSLLDMISQWSRFCFSDPVTADGGHISLSTLANSLTGPFDWHPENFSARFDRGTTKA